MIKLLRTVSTRRLLAAVAGIVIAGCGATAIAVAATSGGPVPAPAALTDALHTALSGPQPAGVSARIAFTDNLVSATTLPQGMSNDPLLTGATGRLWETADELRLELQSDNGDAEVLVSHGTFWAYDPSSNTVYEGTLPQQKPHRVYTYALPTVAQIQARLAKLERHTTVSAATPTDVGGQPAYDVTVSPKQSGGLLGAVQLAFDATNGLPLSAAVFARGDSTPALQLSASSVSYGTVASSVFAISPPAGAKVVKLSGHAAGAAQQGSTSDHKPRVYGTGLDSIFVLRHAAKGAADAKQVIATELGTIIELTRGGVSYLIAGSVTPAAAEAVANTL